MRERCVDTRKHWVPSEHTQTLNAMNSLGILLNDLGERTEARALYERALRGHEKALGPEHTQTLSVVNNLGDLLKNLGERTEARALLERALRGFEKALGPEHPNTLMAVMNLASLLTELAKRDGTSANHARATFARIQEYVGPRSPKYSKHNE